MNEMQIKWRSPEGDDVEKQVHELVLYTELNRLPLLLVCVHTADDPSDAESFELEGAGVSASPPTTWYPMTIEWLSGARRALMVLSPLSTARVMPPVVQNDLNIVTAGTELSAFVPGDKGKIANRLQAGGAFDVIVPWALSINEGAEAWLRRLAVATGGVWSLAPNDEGGWEFFDLNENTAPAQHLEVSADWHAEGTQRVFHSAWFDLSAERPAPVQAAETTMAHRLENHALDLAHPFAWSGQWDERGPDEARHRVVAAMHVFHVSEDQALSAVWNCQAWSLPEPIACDAEQLARALHELAPLRRWASMWQQRLHLGPLLHTVPLVPPPATWPPALPASVVETVQPALEIAPDYRKVYERVITIAFPWAADRPLRVPLVLPMNGKEGTLFFAPAKDDQLFVHFAGGNPSRPLATWFGRTAGLTDEERQREAKADSVFVNGTTLDVIAESRGIPDSALQGLVRGMQATGPLILRGSAVIIEADALILSYQSKTELTPPSAQAIRQLPMQPPPDGLKERKST
ncbi:MAG TPA: hypothetical protein VMK82_02655 [Steroidobacteraceae bacterium]|nr:hypothetical protein [Steroidobacteraceae bacterium]